MNRGNELHDLLDDFAALTQPVSYLEVGVREGDSLFILLSHCLPKRLYLCDDWGVAAGGTGRGSHEHIQRALDDAALAVQPVYLDGDSHVLLKQVRETFQLITIDGDHSGPGAAQDLRDCWPLLEPNGFLFFDDICHPMHTYLDKELDLFLAQTPDARLVRRLKYTLKDITPGCAVVQKVL